MCRLPMTYQLQVLNAGQLPGKAAFSRGDGREGSGDQVLLMPISKGRIHRPRRGRWSPALRGIPSRACLGRGWRVQEGRPSAQLYRAPNAGLLQTAGNFQLAVHMPCTQCNWLEPHCALGMTGSRNVQTAKVTLTLDCRSPACCPHALRRTNLLEPQGHCPITDTGSGDVYSGQDMLRQDCRQSRACSPHALGPNKFACETF